MIERFALRLIVIFIPIYLIIVGYSIFDSLIALLVTELTSVFLAVPAAKSASKLGLKHTILYRVPFQIFLIAWLFSMPYMELMFMNVVIIGFIWGFSRTFYYVSINSEFVENSDRLHRGEETGFFLSLPIIVSMGSPYIGGIILEYFGFPFLFSAFILLMIVSVIPLFLTKDYKKYFKFEFKDVSFRMGNRFNICFFFQGFLLIGEALLWPYYSYIVLRDPISTGLVASLSALGIAFFTLFVGREADKISKNKLLVLGSIGCFIIWTVRFFVATPLEFFVMSFLGGFFLVLVRIPVFAAFANKAIDGNILNHISQREIFLSLGRAAIISVIAFSILSFQAALLLIATSSLLLLIIKLE